MSLPRHVFSDVIYVGPVLLSISRASVTPVIGASLLAQLCRSPQSCVLSTALRDALPRLLGQSGSADENMLYLILFIFMVIFPVAQPAVRLSVRNQVESMGFFPVALSVKDRTV